MRILVVDGDHIVRMLVRRMLGQAGFTGHEFAEAVDGAAAYAKICEWKPGLVLSNWLTPDISGLDLLQRLKAEGNPVPLGFFTAGSTERETEIAASNGALFLVKNPMSATTLRTLLEGIIE